MQSYNGGFISIFNVSNCSIFRTNCLKIKPLYSSDTGIVAGNANFNGLEYYLIFLQARDNIIQHEMSLILQYCLANYWLHCNVMIQNAKGEVLIYTYFPYTPYHCQQAKSELINQFDGVRFRNTTFFPKKLLNLHKCPLVIHTWPQPPYVKVNNLENGTAIFSGLDINVLQALSEDMNFSMQITNVDFKKNDYVVEVNGRVIGPLQGVSSTYIIYICYEIFSIIFIIGNDYQLAQSFSIEVEKT